MYLPRIMIDRFGWPGFIAFAVPNVLGCAAFGYVVKTHGKSKQMVNRHGSAMTWFSIVTIAYQVFFAVWLFAAVLPNVRDQVWMPILAGVIVYGLAVVFSFFDDRDFLVLTALVYGVSLAAFWAVGFDALQQIRWAGGDAPSELWWLTPTIVFGFLLCPYLDLTFHRALQKASSRHAFAVFGVAFAVMIVLTCLIWFAPGIGRMIPALALAHILAQLVFTSGAHMREVRLSGSVRSANLRLTAMLAPALAIPLLFLARPFTNGSAGEGLYLRFIVFYALVFPAYVLLFMRGSETAKPGLGFRVAAIAVILASMPLYELGFLHHRAWLLVLPLAALFGLRVLSSRTARGTPIEARLT
jgi:hypothetical protein